MNQQKPLLANYQCQQLERLKMFGVKLALEIGAVNTSKRFLTKVQSSTQHKKSLLMPKRFVTAMLN